MRTATTLLTATLALLAISTASLGQTIRLKAQANAEYHQDLRLGDIATVTDPQPRRAEELANMIVVADIDKPLQLKAESVLLALMSQRGTGSLGANLQISGSASCQIALTSNKTSAMAPMDTQEPAPAGAAPIPVIASAPPTMPAVRTSIPAAEPGTLRDAIFQRLLKDTGAPRDDLQVEFNTTSPLLDAPAATGQRWLVRPLTRSPLGTVQFESQLAEGTKVLQRITIATEVKRHQRVLVTTAKIGRGEVITADKIRLDDNTYLDRKITTLFESEKDVIGLEAQRDVDIGSQVDQRDFKPLLMARKGDLITILYIAAPLEVQLRGRAQADAKFHDRIEVKNETTNETYTALMIKKNVGVVGVLTAEQEKAIREAP